MEEVDFDFVVVLLLVSWAAATADASVSFVVSVGLGNKICFFKIFLEFFQYLKEKSCFVNLFIFLFLLFSPYFSHRKQSIYFINLFLLLVDDDPSAEGPLDSAVVRAICWARSTKSRTSTSGG
jgi:hypothetical protein